MKHEVLFSAQKGWIRDDHNRAVIFRGVNMSGASKVPFDPDGSTQNQNSLEATSAVTFVGRPFPEEEADSHFMRLKSCGIDLIRWVITWESVEHAGPDEYDEDYLAYLRRLLKKAEEYQIFVFIDPHQDAWSRWTGGDGAPAWTLEKVGFNLSRLEANFAAFTQQGAASEGIEYKRMSWSLNYQRYAAATMFTLFFGGKKFAPDCKIDGINAQEYLQEHFINAMYHVARRLKDCKSIIGFGMLNEPHNGFIGHKDLREYAPITATSGTVPTPFAAITAANGFPSEFASIKLGLNGVTPGKKIPVEPKFSWTEGGIFLPGFSCPWKTAGVWHTENDLPVLDKPEYFSNVNFAQDFLKPFHKDFIAALRKKHPEYLFFTEGSIEGQRAKWSSEDEESQILVDAFHWYDGPSLLLRKWVPHFTVDTFTRKPVFGKDKVKKSMSEQINGKAKEIRSDSLVPFLGEFGIPFDLDEGKSYRTGNYSKQEEALGIYYDALDEGLLSCTLWNYTPTNTHEDGDCWNKEDLSIFNSTTQRLRGVNGFCRPYAMRTAGTPVKMRFIRSPKVIFEFEWDSTPCPTSSGDEDTEIFIPQGWFPKGWRVDKFDGVGALRESPENQMLYVKTLEERRCFIRITEK